MSEQVNDQLKQLYAQLMAQQRANVPNWGNGLMSILGTAGAGGIGDPINILAEKHPAEWRQKPYQKLVPKINIQVFREWNVSTDTSLNQRFMEFFKRRGWRNGERMPRKNPVDDCK